MTDPILNSQTEKLPDPNYQNVLQLLDGRSTHYLVQDIPDAKTLWQIIRKPALDKDPCLVDINRKLYTSGKGWGITGTLNF